MYGFGKVTHMQQGVLKSEPADEADTLEFRNEHFHKDQPDLIYLINRKKAQTHQNEDKALTSTNNNDSTPSTSLALDFRSILSDISTIRKHQTTISAELKELHSSNEQLWKEAYASHERHAKHQETINKIIKFLASVFGGKVVETTLDDSQLNATSSPNPQTNSPTLDEQSSLNNSNATSNRSKRPHKRRLLLKGPDNADQTRFEEIEIPSTDDLILSPATLRTLPSEYPFPSATLSSTQLPTSPPNSLPSPISATLNLPSATSTSTQHNETEVQMREVTPNQIDSFSSQLSLPNLDSFAGPSSDHVDKLVQNTKNYAALTAQMDNLQASLDRIIRVIPTEQLTTNLNDTNKNSNTPDDFDIDTFLKQFDSNNGSSSLPEQTWTTGHQNDQWSFDPSVDLNYNSAPASTTDWNFNYLPTSTTQVENSANASPQPNIQALPLNVISPPLQDVDDLKSPQSQSIDNDDTEEIVDEDKEMEDEELSIKMKDASQRGKKRRGNTKRALPRKKQKSQKIG